jgi:hypothetical protein
MNFFDQKELGNHLLQLCPKVVKHPVYTVCVDKIRILYVLKQMVPIVTNGNIKLLVNLHTVHSCMSRDRRSSCGSAHVITAARGTAAHACSGRSV